MRPARSPQSLRESPPPPVAARLAEQGIGAHDLLLCTPTDIDRFGKYRPQWLIVTHDRILVMDGESPAPVLLDVPRSAATEFRTESGVGSGLLLARVDGELVEVIRYSNREAYRFERAAHKLQHALRGEAISVTPEDAKDPLSCPKCGMMLDIAGEPCAHCVDRGAVLWRMVRLMAPYRKQAVAMMLLLLVGIALDLVSPQLTRYLVDEVLPGSQQEVEQLRQTEGGFERGVVLLLEVVLVLILVQVARAIVNVINGRLASRVGTAITFDMRARLTGHLQQLSVGFYDKQQVGSLMGRVAYDTESLHGFVWQLTGGFLLQILMVVGVGIMMFSIDTTLALYALLPAPFVMGGTVFFWKKIYPRYAHAWDAASKQAGALSGMLSGIRVVKAFSQEERELDRFQKNSARLRATRHSVDSATGTFNPLIGLVFQMGGWIVWFVGGREVLQGTLTLGELMAFFGYLWMFYGPLAALPQFTNWLTQFVTQSNRIFEILDTPVAIVESPTPIHLRPLRGEVGFDQVTFGYSRHTPIINNVSFNIEAGEMIGLVGPSGAGKSTLINLLCRFYDVDDGRVLIDGVDVRDLAKGELRSQIGVVLQEPFLFRGTIMANLAYGRPDAEPEQIIEAAKAANCHDFILRHTHAYDTWLGERGAGLSGGERQRASIARVLLTDPRILILDEATSSVDAESEAAIQSALRTLVKGRTTIAIAHRLSTLRGANRIIALERGRIAEMGTHLQLLQTGGLYSRLVRLQAAGLTLDEDVPEHAVAATGESKEEYRGVRWLEPGQDMFASGTHNTIRVRLREGDGYGGVYAVRCMPVKFGSRYISIRHVDPSGHEREVGIIRDLLAWPAETRRLIYESLQLRYFVHVIRAIHDIEEVRSYLNFDVETDRGPMLFTTRTGSDAIQDYGEHGKLIQATDENRFLIPNIDALSERERRLFKRHVYW